jgi:fatty-acyl-CoA synthase
MMPIRTLRAAATVSRANARLGERPDRLLRAAWAMRPYGTSALGAVAAAVARTPHRPAIVDGSGSVTYRELWVRSHALAVALADRGLGPGTHLGILCGNGTQFVESLLAASLLGTRTVLLNTRLAEPQVRAVAVAEDLDVVIAGDGLSGLAAASGVSVLTASECASLVAAHLGERHRTREVGRIVLLTSGTTGHPRGASRPRGGELEGTAAIVARIPLRHGDTRVIAAPVFHGWGLTHLLLGLGMSATVVLHDHFDAEAVLRSVAAHRAQVLVLVPVMLQRILELPAPTLASIETGSVRAIVCSGSALPARVAAEALRRFGPVLYNVYGSTEVAVATIATPADLLDRPDSAGRPVPGTVLRILGDDDRPVARGATGRIFVRNALQFDGYTTGGGTAVVDGLMSSGDVGRIDRKGRLVVAGREDDMIISGGENVHPREVEEVLVHHPDVTDVAVVGVPDERFGQALRACVVLRPGAGLGAEPIRSYVRGRLAAYEVPRDVVFLDELPRNAMGKVLRNRLV